MLARLLLGGPVVLVGDDLVGGHPGKKVYGKARHRDPVRSSHGYTGLFAEPPAEARELLLAALAPAA